MCVYIYIYIYIHITSTAAASLRARRTPRSARAAGKAAQKSAALFANAPPTPTLSGLHYICEFKSHQCN